jgi:hypothetical protein
MKSEEEIREAIEAAKQREEGIDYKEGGAIGSNQLLASMCQANVEALKWVLEEEDGFINGLAGYKATQEGD